MNLNPKGSKGNVALMVLLLGSFHHLLQYLLLELYSIVSNQLIGVGLSNRIINGQHGVLRHCASV
jgi:hypothetical protein